MPGIEKEYGICTWPHIFSFQVYTQYIIRDKTNLSRFIFHFIELRRDYLCKLRWTAAFIVGESLAGSEESWEFGLLATLNSYTWMRRLGIVFRPWIHVLAEVSYFQVFNQIMVPHGEKWLAQCLMLLIALTTLVLVPDVLLWWGFFAKEGPSGVLAESINICYHSFKEKRNYSHEIHSSPGLSHSQSERQMRKVELGLIFWMCLIHLYIWLEL